MGKGNSKPNTVSEIQDLTATKDLYIDAKSIMAPCPTTKTAAPEPSGELGPLTLCEMVQNEDAILCSYNEMHSRYGFEKIITALHFFSDSQGKMYAVNKNGCGQRIVDGKTYVCTTEPFYRTTEPEKKKKQDEDYSKI